VFVIAVVILLGVIDLPFSLVRQFRIEARYGFNRMTPRLWLADLANPSCWRPSSAFRCSRRWSR